MKEAMLINYTKQDIVADIGGYVGEFSMCISPLVKRIYTFEASPNTFKVLKLNKQKNMKIYNKAVIAGNDDSVALYLSKGIGVTNSIVKEKGTKTIVDAISYKKAISKANIVKIDVEGAEYTYDIADNLDNLKAITIEFHPIVGRNWKKDANKIMNEIEKQNFKCLTRPSFDNGWDMNGSWER